MINSKKQLYLVFFIACMAGYAWLFYALSNDASNHSLGAMCFMKRITNIPCPACGATRSVAFLLDGNIPKALHTNPLGIFIAVIMIVMPVWLLFDLLIKRGSLFSFYIKTECFFRKPLVLCLFFSLICLNWIWNITKGL